MKKIFFGIIALSSLLLLVGCDKKENKNIETTTKTTITNNKQETIYDGKKYIQIAPSTSDLPIQDDDNYLILNNGKATAYAPYWNITSEGNYEINNNNITIHFTKKYGVDNNGDSYEDIIDKFFYAHIDGDKIIVDSMSISDNYVPESYIYQLQQ